MEPCKILSSDTGRHPAFFQFIDSIFHGSRAETWTRWRDHGGWTEDYEVFAIVDGARIVSTIGRSRMQLVINGEDQVGYQLGAIATLESYRRQGLARRLMNRVIEELDEPDQPIILFANDSVLDFYPRLGFKRIPQRRSTAEVFIEPSGTPARRCDPSSAADRSRLAKLCAQARPSRGPLAARDYHWILLWNLICGPATAFWLREVDALIAASVENERLVIHDVIARQPFDLELTIPALITQPVTELEFLFDPEGWWPTAIRSELDDADSTLFVRGRAASIAGPVQLPELAHT
jgi:predicted N-acetyltransferase YhbS